ncbi:hypothetical protein VTI28DRAFT_6566 [Corynascus sepedonium]
MYVCVHVCANSMVDNQTCSGPSSEASRFFWEDVRDPIMQDPRDVLLVFDCTALPGVQHEHCSMRIEAGMVASLASTKQLLGACVPVGYHSTGMVMTALHDVMTQSLCRVLDRTGDMPLLTVQKVCSLIREDLRDTQLAPRVFVSQLGGGQLLDIYLPRLPLPLTAEGQSLHLRHR